MSTTLTIEAVYEDGVLRPVEALPLKPAERVTITVHVTPVVDWPEDTAEIYKETEAEDRKPAAAMWPGVKATWPKEGEKDS